MTWRQLKELLDKLPEEHVDDLVTSWPEGCDLSIINELIKADQSYYTDYNDLTYLCSEADLDPMDASIVPVKLIDKGDYYLI